MSGKHGHSHKPFEGHMHDFDAHIRAVEEDLEYYRAKRFEPRIFYLLRRGVVTFADLLKARVAPRGTHGECGARLERLPGIARGICPGADPSRLVYPGGVGAALEAAPRGAAVDGRRDCRQGVDRCDIQASAVNDGERSAQRNGHKGKVGKLVVVENTDSVHNVVVCTLCSCYPYDILGDTPWWYKHESYRTKIVQNPRACMQEMLGLEIPASKEVQVYDSTSDVRYFVLPKRPAGTEGMSEEELAKLVTVDSLIGAGRSFESVPAQRKRNRPPGTRNAASAARLSKILKSMSNKFKIGDPVVVASENPTGNPRTPRYIRGKRGVVGMVHGVLENIRDHRGVHQPLYTVRSDLSELSTCQDLDFIWVDVHEEWLSRLQPDG